MIPKTAIISESLFGQARKSWLWLPFGGFAGVVLGGSIDARSADLLSPAEQVA